MNNQDVDDLLPHYRRDFVPDTEAALARLHDRITPVPRLDGRDRRGRGKWSKLAVAAAIALILGLTFLFKPAEKITLHAAHENKTVTLPDYTTVLLQQGSSITYGEDFGGTTRSVVLDGQGYFEVTHGTEVPFLVTAPSGAILYVTGTAFNLRASEGEFEVEVSEGSVELRLGEGKWPVADHECGIIKGRKPATVRPAPSLNRHAWRTGQFSYTDTPLAEVVRDVENAFGVSVELEGAGDCDFRVGGDFSGASAAAALDHLARIGGGRARSLGEGRNFELRGVCD